LSGNAKAALVNATDAPNIVKADLRVNNPLWCGGRFVGLSGIAICSC
jgi:hypothetical protein